MKIATFKDLYTNKAFIALNRQASEYGFEQQAASEEKYTHSRKELISFLVIYAGLPRLEKTCLIDRLNNAYLKKDELDDLISNIDWESMLFQKGNTETGCNSAFKITIGVSNKSIYMEQIKVQCEQLFKALENLDCVHELKDECTMRINLEYQEEQQWTMPVKLEYDVWTFAYFELSQHFKETLAAAEGGESLKIGNFNVKKGTGNASDEKIILQIKSPSPSNVYEKSQRFFINNGMYQIPIGMENICGPLMINDVKYETRSNVTFSDEGKVCSQSVTTTDFKDGHDTKLNNETVISFDHKIFKCRLEVSCLKFYSDFLENPFLDRDHVTIPVIFNDNGVNARLPRELSVEELERILLKL